MYELNFIVTCEKYFRKYCLPSGTGLSKNHPNLRSITCHTLADLIAGKHKDSVNSFR